MKKFILGAMLLAALPTGARAADWGDFTTPSKASQQAIGSYAQGCLAGATALPIDGEGYQLLRLSRHRYFGHKRLIDFIQSYGHQVKGAGLGHVLVGDMSQPRGGPMSFGHGSHQIGLDVDFWFGPSRAIADIEHPEPVSMITPDGWKVDSRHWSDGDAKLVRLAAKFPDVDRVFVNPAIKRELCRTAGPDRDWLTKVRPWWGHDEHFHVRLKCPADSPLCQPQREVEDEGCGAELDSWFNGTPKAAPHPVPPHPAPRKRLPAQCQVVLKR